MDTLVENKGIPHQDKPNFIPHTEKEHIVPVENADAEASSLEGKRDDNEAHQHAAEIAIKPASDKIKAGYRYAFVRR